MSSNFLSTVELNKERFLGLLEKLLNESIHLQNSPAQGLIPREDLAANHVLDSLKPYLKENGGVLEAQKVNFVEGRGNVIIKYPGTTDKIVSFVGSHFDVVPADPVGWSRDPFKLTIEGDMLYGRGTTDCLGHISLLTDFMITLATHRPSLTHSIVVVFIANEENGLLHGIGAEQLAKEGYMDELKGGPVFWVDAADSQPCIGSAGATQWEIKAEGRLMHSGFPHKAINSIEFAMDSVAYVQKRFYQDYPRDPREDEYEFAVQSNLKPTQVTCSTGALNQIPAWCIIQGDIRCAPFYSIFEIRDKVQVYVDEINNNPSLVENPEIRGPHSKYNLPDDNIKGNLTLKWVVGGDDGIACRLDSKGYLALCKATETVLGSAKPYSVTGSLPLVRQLFDQGFDVQISGYGLSAK
jgi:acetylornithine deacetylase